MKCNSIIGLLLCLLLSVNTYAGFGGSKSTSATTAKPSVSFKATTVSNKPSTTTLSQRADSTRMQSKAANVYQESTKPKATTSTYTAPTYSTSTPRPTTTVTPSASTYRDTTTTYRERTRSRDTSDSGNGALLGFVAGVAVGAVVDNALDQKKESEAREARQQHEAELARYVAKTPEQIADENAESDSRTEAYRVYAEQRKKEKDAEELAIKKESASSPYIGFLLFIVIVVFIIVLWNSSPYASTRRRSTMS